MLIFIAFKEMPSMQDFQHVWTFLEFRLIWYASGRLEVCVNSPVNIEGDVLKKGAWDNVYKLNLTYKLNPISEGQILQSKFFSFHFTYLGQAMDFSVAVGKRSCSVPCHKCTMVMLIFKINYWHPIAEYLENIDL